jgi:hypothetical protein
MGKGKDDKDWIRKEGGTRMMKEKGRGQKW